MCALSRAIALCAAAGVTAAGAASLSPAPAAAAPGAVASPTPTSSSCEVLPTHQIAEVQGSGDATPLAGQTVRVEGVVTADLQEDTQLRGFFIQDPTPDADPATSEGLFVFAGTSLRDVKTGDRVLVTGRAVEFNGWTELSPVSAVDVCGTGTIKPQRYALPRPPGVSFEPVENMLLTFPEPLSVSDHYNLGRYGELTLSAGGRLYQPTDRPGVDEAANQRRALLLDDGSTVENPETIPYTEPRPVRLGDVASGVTGVLGYGFGSYRLHPTKKITFLPRNPRPLKPQPVGGNVKVAGFNTLNWFTTVGSRGATTPQERDRQLAKLVAALKGLNADAVGLLEIENNGRTALDALVDALNAELGAGTYAALAHPDPGTDAIQVGIIYKPAKLTPVGPARSSADPVFQRRPLAQTFKKGRHGASFTMIVNHYKSKRCGDGPTGPDADQGDGQGCWNALRVRQAQATLAMIDALRLPGPVVVGDLNAYGEEDPIAALAAGGLVDVVAERVPAPQRYSYLFEGRAGRLDHALVGRDLRKRVTGATIWHINADEARILDYNTEFNPPGLYRPDAFRAGDHDPVLVGLTL